MTTNRLEHELGANHKQLILDYLASERVVSHGYSPTWWITSNNNWKGKSYWVRKALEDLQASQKVESFRYRGSVGWCWALTGKMKRG